MLSDAVSAGTGTNARIPGYVVAGKTGTAQKAIPGGYSTSRYVASFIGFVPARDPQLVVLVVVDEPCAHFGGVVAEDAPVQRVDGAANHLREENPDAVIEENTETPPKKAAPAGRPAPAGTKSVTTTAKRS